MLIRDEKRVSKIDRMGRIWHIRVLVLECDQCGHVFERSGPNIDRHSKKDFHFCSDKCVLLAKCKGGKIRHEIELTCQEKYEASSPLGSKICQDKSIQTCMEKYGVHYPGAVPALIQKRKETCVKRYGKTSFLATQTCRNILRSDIVIQKRHETLKRNGTYGKSKIEDEFYQKLCLEFNVPNVMRQVSIGNWIVDFYIQNIDVYVQFDGVYWHGLDRPIEAIAEHKTKRDEVIHRKWKTDCEQNDWFVINQIKLVRVTDVEFISDQQACIKKIDATRCV
jgi:very-short-patch-repair endonuclease